jgi:hypothetical protein
MFSLTAIISAGRITYHGFFSPFQENKTTSKYRQVKNDPTRQLKSLLKTENIHICFSKTKGTQLETESETETEPRGCFRPTFP